VGAGDGGRPSLRHRSSGCGRWYTVRYTLSVIVSSNRAQILHVALELFAGRGYGATGIQEIVDAAGISKPTLYHYFGSKRGLLAALVEEHAADFLAGLRAATTYRGNLPTTLKRVAMTYLGFAAAQPAFYRFLLSLLFAPPESEAYAVAAPIFDEQRRLLEELFAAVARDHGNMRGRQQRYAHSFLGVLNSYAFLVLQGHLRPSERLAFDVVHQFSHGIYS
jgi:AcrR family transcriptional regulator